jgi:DNA/RNA-binding protein KIN17
MHTQSESHVRKLLLVGEDPKKFLNDYSNQFLRDFTQLLRTGHGEKKIGINRFYQEYIANKEHVHMNSTKWSSLTEFAKYLGREGICRVEESDKDGLTIAWIDNSPEALRRQEALKKKEAQDQGDDELEQRMIKEQIKRAQASADSRKKEVDEDPEDRELKRQDGEKIKLSFGAKPAPKSDTDAASPSTPATGDESAPAVEAERPSDNASTAAITQPKPGGFGGAISMKLGTKPPQTKNVFAQAKKNALSSGGSKKPSAFGEPKKMSEAERIMKEEMERKKRPRDSAGFGMPNGAKKQRSQ